jgi:hypothetical protein
MRAMKVRGRRRRNGEIVVADDADRRLVELFPA